MQSDALARDELDAAEVCASQSQWRAPQFDSGKFAARQRHNLVGCLHECAVHPDSVLCDFIGLLYDWTQQVGEATAAFQQSLQLDPTNHIAHANLTRILQQKGQSPPGDPPLQQNAPSPRQVGIAWWSRAFYHMRMHQCQDAIRCFERAHAILPDEPKLSFYLATQLNRRGRKADHQRALELLQRISPQHQSVSRLEVQSQLLRAAGGALSKREAETLTQTLLAEARRIFATASREPDALKSYSAVLISAADVWRERRQSSRALSLFDEAIQAAQDHAGTRAFHNRAIVRQKTGDAAGAKRDLLKALALEPDSYAAAIDLVKMLFDAGEEYDAALDLCVRTLHRADCNPGMQNRIQLLDLQMQLLSAMSQPIPSCLLDAIMPLITAFDSSAKPTAASPAGCLLARVKGSVVARWLEHLKLDGIPDPTGSIRLIDVHLQLRNFEQAEQMLRTQQDGDDHQFQRARLSFLRHVMAAHYAEAADVQLAVARLTLQHAAAGDTFDRRALRWPGDDAAIPRPAVALCFPTFRSSLATAVQRSLPSDASACLSEPVHMARCLQSLHLLCTPSLPAAAAPGAVSCSSPSPGPSRSSSSSSSSSPSPGHVERTRELALRVHQLFISLFDGDPMWHRLDVPEPVMSTAARVLLALAAAAPGDEQEMQVAAVYRACGSCATSGSPPVNLCMLLAQQLCCGTTPVSAHSDSFQDTAAKLIELRALHLQLHVQQLQQISSFSATSPSTSVPGDAVRAVAVQLVDVARTLLDYFISAFKCLLSTSGPPASESAPAKRSSGHLAFPRVPVGKPGATEDLLLGYLSSRVGFDFRTHLPRTFAVLLQAQPHRDPVDNAWLEQLYLVRNVNRHSHSVVTRGVCPTGSTQPINEVQLARTVMQRLPALLRGFKHACDADCRQIGTSPPEGFAVLSSPLCSPSQLLADSFHDQLNYLRAVQCSLSASM